MAPRQPTIREIRFLSDTETFGPLSDDELNEIQRVAEVIEYPAGKTIFERGAPGDAVYAIMSGRVDILTMWTDGREIKLNIHDAGHVIGEIGALDGKERTASAVAAADTRIVRIRRPDLLRFLDAKPGRWTRMAALLCDRIRWTSDRIEATVFLDIPRRLAHQIAVLARAYGKQTPAGIEIDTNFTQDELAQMLGVTRESVNKGLRQLTDLKAIRYHRGRISVLSLDALRDFTGPID